MPGALPKGEDKILGTKKSGYAGAEYGPFECENCRFFTKPQFCGHPEVIADKEVPKVDKKAKVNPEGCCTYFITRGK